MARGGYPGMGGNMQKKVEELQAELDTREVEASAGGGAVKVVCNGKKEIINIHIDESVVDPEDVEMLQDLVMAAANEAIRAAEDMVNREMGKITGGLNIPGM